MFYLIGVEHGVQSVPVTGVETPNHTEYRVSLEQAIRTCKPITYLYIEEVNKTDRPIRLTARRHSDWNGLEKREPSWF
jgi:hypothetical protein